MNVLDEDGTCGNDTGNRMKRKKRVITNARKEQNRVAQRAYRQKRKESFHASQQTVLTLTKKQRELRPYPPVNCGTAEADCSNTIDACLEPRSTQEQSTDHLGFVNATEQTTLLQPLVDINGISPDNVVETNGVDPENFVLYSIDPTAFASGIDLSTTSNPLPPDPISSNTPYIASDPHGNPGFSGALFGSNCLVGPMMGTPYPAVFDTTDQTASRATADPSYLTTQFELFQQHPPVIPISSSTVGPALQLPDSFTHRRVALLNHRNTLRDVLVHQGVEDVILAGLDLLFAGRIHADPYMNSLRTSGTSTLTACLHNARCLGIRIQDLFSPKCGFAPYRTGIATCNSPFYRFITAADDVKDHLAAACDPLIPAHLRPTLPQVLFPHPAFLDLLPFPAIRARAITLAATTPQFFDLQDLKKDFLTDGIVFVANSNGKGEPWDMRSWSMASWFRSKWRVLIDGEEGVA